MAALLVVLSGWLGLAFAVVGQALTDATFAQFLQVWMLCGLTSFALLWTYALAHKASAQAQPDHA